MGVMKAMLSVKPGQDIFSLDMLQIGGQKCLIRSIRPQAKSIHKAMLPRVQVNVGYQPSQMGFGFNLDAAEWFLEKTSRPSVSFIDRFRVSVE
jgi:hypothetical protein